MCRLFGLIANKNVDIEFSLLKADLPFKDLSKNNPHGWGIGYYEKDIAVIQKQPVPALQSKEFQDIARNVKSKMFVSHVRYSTHGGKTLENTHPFKYNNWIFAHNGNIDIKDLIKEQLLHKYIKCIKGETDSEIFFFWLIQNIDEYDIIEGIKKAIEFIEKNNGDNTSSLNFLLTNGKKYYALRKAFTNIGFYSLFYLMREPQKKNISSYKSKETGLLIKSKKLFDEKAIIVCSEKLTEEENWITIHNKSLMIIDKNLEIIHIGL